MGYCGMPYSKCYLTFLQCEFKIKEREVFIRTWIIFQEDDTSKCNFFPLGYQGKNIYV